MIVTVYTVRHSMKRYYNITYDIIGKDGVLYLVDYGPTLKWTS